MAAGVELGAGLDPRRVQLLYDPQTSGGLLVAIAPEAVAAALMALCAAPAVAAHQIGRVEPRKPLARRLARRVRAPVVAVTLR